MKKLIFILLLFGLQTQAQINYCDSLSYTTTSTINYPFIVTGVANIPGIVSWNWTVCNSALCYSSSGVNASFGQVSLTDTLKVCYDVLIDVNGVTYACSGCDSLVYNPNSYQWESAAQPVGISEIELNTINDNKMYDLLGREIFEVPKGAIYIKSGKKYITNGRKP
tara:strand:- start:22 stop:519 length:498 start_codon:yes stop_codon:yes gene_type:complete